MEIEDIITKTPVGAQMRRVISEHIEKRRMDFAAAPKDVMEDLELLSLVIHDMEDDAFTVEYGLSLLQQYPVLVASSPDKIGVEKTKSTRRRFAPTMLCTECRGPVSGGSCTNCGRTYQEIHSGSGKNKSSSDISEKMSQFNDELRKLLAEVPLPTAVSVKTESIRDWLEKHRVHLSGPVPTKQVRAAFRANKLETQYIWCTAMWYKLTDWKPKPFSAEEIAAVQGYYQRALSAFFKRMMKTKSDGTPLMSNLWSVQAILRVIIKSSSSLLRRHYDFYVSLHAQNSQTDEAHYAIWNEMSFEERWTFE